jgi:hypothetical protein
VCCPGWPQNRSATTTIQPYERSLGCAAQACCCSSTVQHNSSTLLRHALDPCREERHESLVSHRSAVRGRDLRNDPDLSASNAAWSRTERRWGEGHHLWARPSSSTAGGETRVPSRATCCPSRLLILFERQHHKIPATFVTLPPLPMFANCPAALVVPSVPGGLLRVKLKSLTV